MPAYRTITATPGRFTAKRSSIYEMTEWKRLDDGSVPGKATIEKAKTHRMERGQAGIFQNRAIHSIAYPTGARFIRVTGTNLENIARGRYNSEAGTMIVEKRPNFRGAA